MVIVGALALNTQRPPYSKRSIVISTTLLRYGKIQVNVRFLSSLETCWYACPIAGNDESS